MAVLVGVFCRKSQTEYALAAIRRLLRPFCCRIFASESFISNSTQSGSTAVRFNAHYNYVCVEVSACVCVHFYGLVLRSQIGTKQAHLMACPPGGVAQNIMCELHTLCLHVCVCLGASVFASLSMHIIHFIRSVDATTLSYLLLGLDIGYTWFIERGNFEGVKSIKYIINI